MRKTAALLLALALAPSLAACGGATENTDTPPRTEGEYRTVSKW